MTARRALIAGAVLAGVIALAAVAWRHGGVVRPGAAPEAGPDVTAGAGAAAGGDSGAGEGIAASHPEAAHLPLPPLETPLRLVVDDLRRRAEAGEAPAACRLAAEFERCQSLRAQVRRQRSSRERMEARVDRASEQEIENVARALAGMDGTLAARTADLEHCAGTQEPDAGQRARYWRNAALAGHPAAMRHYAIGNAFRFRDLMSAVPELEIYRREAESLARRAAGAGDAAMIHALAMAYLPPDERADEPESAGFRPFLAQSIHPDPQQALVWLHALQRHPGTRRLPEDHPFRALPAREIDRLAASLSAAEAAAAAAAADDRVRTWPPGVAETVRVPVHVNGGIGDVGREECDRG